MTLGRSTSDFLRVSFLQLRACFEEMVASDAVGIEVIRKRLRNNTKAALSLVVTWIFIKISIKEAAVNCGEDRCFGLKDRN